MKDIIFENVTKKFGDTTILNNINLTIKAGERLILLGPSGCGKSTILRMISGLEDITEGILKFGEKVMNKVPAGERGIAMVFQNYALYPHMTVEKNITYALTAHKTNKEEIADRLKIAIEMLGLTGLEKRKPKELSGGQRQRVALARAVVKRSDYFLLDEPLSNLDAQLRHRARKELSKIHERFGQTFVYVTHDQTEAMTLGDRVAVLNAGSLQQLDTPDKIFNTPANVFVATFIGQNSCNIVSGYCNGNVLNIEGQEVTISKKIKTQNIIIGIRPEHIDISREKLPNSVAATITITENQGDSLGVYFKLNETEWLSITKDKSFTVGETIYFQINENKLHVFDNKTQKNLFSANSPMEVQS